MADLNASTRIVNSQVRNSKEEKPVYNLLAGDDTNFSKEVIPRLPKTPILKENIHTPSLGRLYLHHNRGFRLLQERAMAARQSRS